MAMLRALQPVALQPVIGPYSPGYLATGVSNLVFISGQIPKDASGRIVGENNIEAATKQVLENLRTVLVSASATPSQIVKTTVFLVDMNDFEGMNKAYAAFFGKHCPARSTVQVAKLPANARVEIEAVAAL
jgi:2-iminobutanoate/2-iminopropanoate deaminase